jgi:hypothetical protein
MAVAGGAAVGISGPSRAEIEARLADKQPGKSWANDLVKGTLAGLAIAATGLIFLTGGPPEPDCGLNPETGELYGFACTPDDLDEMPIAERLDWINQFAAQTDSGDWFNNIDGIISGFVETGRAEPGSWLSVVDSYILVAIQDGYALYDPEIIPREMSPEELENALLWKEFFDELRDNEDPKEIYNKWGQAEQSATDYGVILANELDMTYMESIFLFTGDIYRYLVANNAEYVELRDQAEQIRNSSTCAIAFPCNVNMLGIELAFDFVIDITDPQKTYRFQGKDEHAVYHYSKILWKIDQVCATPGMQDICDKEE